MNRLFDAACDVKTFSVEDWLDELESKGNAQEDEALARCEAFYAELSSYVS